MKPRVLLIMVQLFLIQSVRAQNRKTLVIDRFDYQVIGELTFYEIDSVSKRDTDLENFVQENADADSLFLTYKDVDKSGTLDNLAMMLLDNENCIVINKSTSESIKYKKKKWKRKNYKRHYAGGIKYIDVKSKEVILEHTIWIN